MQERQIVKTAYLPLKTRLLALLVYALVLFISKGLITANWSISGGGPDIWFFSALGLLCFSLLTAPFFQPPRDSLANVTAVALLLGTLDLPVEINLYTELNVFRWLSFSIALLTGVAAIIAIYLYKTDSIARPNLAKLSRLCYKLSCRLGKGEVLFTLVALISIVGFHQSEPLKLLWLLFLWGLLIYVKPVELFFEIKQDFNTISLATAQSETVGTIQRIDDPNIVRVSLTHVDSWKSKTVHLACLPSSEQVYVLPLFTQMQGNELVGTGMIHGKVNELLPETLPGNIYVSSDSTTVESIVNELSGCKNSAELIGFVVENSTISHIRFEVSANLPLSEGSLVFCKQNGHIVYYQILDAQTAEESFQNNPRGIHVVTAAQLGIYDNTKGFIKYGWLPSMNTAVFLLQKPAESTSPLLVMMPVSNLAKYLIQKLAFVQILNI